MTELSLNILDIVQNSVRAEADEIRIEITESVTNDIFELIVSDNGKGIPAEILSTVDDAFTTTRTTRKIGLGLPLLKYHAELTGGNLSITSDGKGTIVKARFGLTHIDRQPLGDITGVLIILISSNPEISIFYSHKTDSGTYSFSTTEIKEALETEKLDDFSLLQDIKEMIKSNLENIGVSD
jgi:hypothetical protein